MERNRRKKKEKEKEKDDERNRWKKNTKEIARRRRFHCEQEKKMEGQT